MAISTIDRAVSGEILAKGMLSRELLDEVMQDVATSSKSLGQIIEEKGYLPRQQVEKLYRGMERTIAEARFVLATNDDYVEFIRQFESCSLPLFQWTHRAHLLVAMWYLAKFPAREATDLIRDGIRKFNEHNGIKTTKDSGYHESLTLFWVCVVRCFLDNASPQRLLPQMAADLITICGDKFFPLQYYNRNTIMSWQARIDWVKPDLKPVAANDFSERQRQLESAQGDPVVL